MNLINTICFITGFTLYCTNWVYSQSYDQLALQGYSLYGKGLANKDTNLLKQAGDLIVKAGTQVGGNVAVKEALLWDAAMIYGMAQDTSNTFKALEMCLAVGMTDAQKVSTRPVFDYLKTMHQWKALIGRFREAERTYVLQLKNQALRYELLQMWAEDQRLRFLLRDKVRELKENWGAPELAPLYSEIKRTDSSHYGRIQQIIAQSGWPKLTDVGKDGSFAVWSLVQHSNIVDFQEQCIKAMKPLLALNEVDPTNYANLVDRVQFNKKQKQLYGQAQAGYPIADETKLNKRRKKLGLIPMEEYAHLNGFEYKPENKVEKKRIK